MADNTSFPAASECYSRLGVDVDAAIDAALATPVSLHCWQGDDVAGFEAAGTNEPGGGLAVTGNYPGRARTVVELRRDLEFALRLIPGAHRLNLHAIYGEFGEERVDRDAIEVWHYQGWIDWCRGLAMGLDFNPTCFGHPLAEDGFTLSHPDPAVRAFWVEHCRRCRSIGAEMGLQTGSPTITNVWIPDGMKDSPVDRLGPRQRLTGSLDEIFAEALSPQHNLDAVESKLFGIGSESYVVGSHEFYLAYAIRQQIYLCLDAGHFHPTESVVDKLSAALPVVPGVLLHLSRGVRWDSDHVVLFDDETLAIVREVVRCRALPRVRIGLDFFDASINRVAAWVIGARAARKALLWALLEPIDQLRAAEAAGDYTTRLSIAESVKTLPFGSVWNELCRRQNVPDDRQWLAEVRDYEKQEQAARGTVRVVVESVADRYDENDWDLLIFGGGPAGLAAVLHAGHVGLRVLLIEKSGLLGGTTTLNGVVLPGLFHAWGRQIIAGHGWQLVRDSVLESGGELPDFSDFRQRHWKLQVPVNRAVYAALADERVIQAGGSVLFHSQPVGCVWEKGWWHVEVAEKSGLRSVRARHVIDCTGDANVAQLAGYAVRRNQKKQPATLMYRLAGYDFDTLDTAALQAEFAAGVERGEVVWADIGLKGDNAVRSFFRSRGQNRNHSYSF